MRSSRAAIDEAFDRLQEHLLAMSPGDQISVSRAVEISGLDTEQCDAVLNALDATVDQEPGAITVAPGTGSGPGTWMAQNGTGRPCSLRSQTL